MIAGIVVTAFAAIAVVVPNPAAAIRARYAAPLFEPHVRRPGVVGGQHRAEHEEGFGEAAVLQSPLQGHRGIPGADVRLEYVRVDDIVPPLGRVRFQGVDFKAVHPFGGSEPIPVEIDGEGAEFDVAQGDRLGDDTDDLLLPPHLDPFELVFQLPHVG